MPRPCSLLRAQTYTPMIKFLGKRTFPQHGAEPHAHPESPSGELPKSFQSSTVSKADTTAASSDTRELSSETHQHEYLARNQLPLQYQYSTLSDEEMLAIDSGGATAY